MNLRIAYLMTSRVLRDLLSLLLKFSAVIIPVGFFLWIMINYERFADFIGWVVATLFAIMCLMLLALYLMSVYDDVRRVIK